MALADDQQPVGEFSPQGAYDSFADGVRSGRLRGRARTLMSSAANRASKESVNWPAQSLIRNLTETVRWPRSIRSGGLLVSSTLCLPKISSALVGVLSGFAGLDALVALRRSACCGMMVRCAATTCLPRHDQRVRVTATAPGQRPGQGRRDPGAAPPDHRPGTAAGHDPAAVLPRRPGVPRGPAAPPPPRRPRPVPAGDPPGHGACAGTGTCWPAATRPGPAPDVQARRA